MRRFSNSVPGQDIMTIEAGQPIPKATFQIKTDEGSTPTTPSNISPLAAP